VIRHLKRYKKRMRDGTIHRPLIDDIRTTTGGYPPVEKDTHEQSDFLPLVNRLLTMEESLAAQYIKMEHDLPDGTGWNATPLKNLILSQRRCVDLLEKFSDGRE
jgi:hypothetical protein